MEGLAAEEGEGALGVPARIRSVSSWVSQRGAKAEVLNDFSRKLSEACFWEWERDILQGMLV